MRPCFSSLPWLPATPPDFKDRCRALETAEEPPGPELQCLAGSRLDAAQSRSLAGTIRRLRGAGRDLAPLSDFRLGILANTTFDLILDCLPAAAARHGVAVEMLTTPYDQVMQQALDPASDINQARPDAVLVAVDHRWLGLERACLTGSPEDRISAGLERLRVVAKSLSEHGGAPAILATAPAPPETLFGSYERRVAGALGPMIAEANRRIVDLAEETGAYLLDVAALAERVGADSWFDPVQWAAYKLPFAAQYFPAYADLLGRLLGAIRGKSRKCLVLDLDNTLWGGVIGDDGVDGIRLGQNSPSGEAFLSVQRAALDLRDRGVLLAICSKNTDEVARGPFREHPDMLLREGHIAVFQANWIDKATNLETIARTLNLGLDALVLLDDDPAERAQVRAALPMVATPELPQDPSWYARTLAAAGYFEATAYSAEDRLRAQSYATEGRRAEVMEKSRDLGDYLASLEMALRFSPFDSPGRRRIAQLINKTNQFNLTTRRYTEAQVAALEADKSTFTLQVGLGDKFSDLGMIGVAICRPAAGDPACWEIDTWLMSCRALGRRVEEAMLAKIVAKAAKRGVARLVGLYIPTARNGLVADHYAKLHFELTEQSPGRRRYELAVADFSAVDLPFRAMQARGDVSREGVPTAGVGLESSIDPSRDFV